MTTTLDSRPKLGGGVYTLPDIASILGIPYHRVARCVKEYWDMRLASDFDGKYSWHDGKSRAVNFHTLIELFVFFQLNEAGVRTPNILKAHTELSRFFSTPYPFANADVLRGMRTDGKVVFFEIDNNSIISLDGKKQFNLAFLKEFFKNIDFDDSSMAVRLWPIGKDHSVVVDPKHQFGQPTVEGTNIRPAVIYQMHQGGESPRFIASLYDLSVTQVEDSIEFCKKAA